MKLTLIAAAILGLLATTPAAYAGDGLDDPFPYRAPGIVVVRPSRFADTGSNAYPGVSNRPGQRLVDGQGTLAASGNEGEVQTAASLPRGSFDGAASVREAQSADRWFAMRAARHLAARQPARIGQG